MKHNYKLILSALTMILASLACGQFEVGIEPTPTPTLIDFGPHDASDEPAATQAPTEPVEDFSEYWREVEDYRTGLRFAIPCFWDANIPLPEQDPSGLGSFAVNNFSQDFVSSLGPKRGQTVFEIGGLKFDIGYHQLSSYGLGPDSSLEALATAIVNPDNEHGITSTERISVNGLDSILVNTFSIFGEGQFYLIPMSEEFSVMFAPSVADHPDIQAILQSLTVDPDDEMVLPMHKPAGPPEGMAAPCLGLNEGQSGDASSTAPIQSSLDCASVTDQNPKMWTICNVRDSFVSRNTQPLMGYMSDPFFMGYWQSEGAKRSLDEALAEILGTHMPADTSSMTFTMNREEFPSLFGAPPDQMFGPENVPDAIIYSEGWGADGQGAALLYFREEPDGKYRWYAMVVAPAHFDK